MPGAAAPSASVAGPHRGSLAPVPGLSWSQSETVRSKPSLWFMPGASLGCRGRVVHRRRAPLASGASPRYRRDFTVPNGIPQRGGDLRQWQVEIVMQDDDRPLLRLEAAEATFELVAVGDRRTRRRRRRRVR